MPSAFDLIDKQHRAREPIKRNPLSADAECPDPKCRGRMSWEPVTDGPDEFRQLACDCCGFVQERFA